MIPAIYSDILQEVKRRTDWLTASRDIFNNPVYGAPISGWNTIYSNIGVRLAFTGKEMFFAATGERVIPAGIMYYPPTMILYPEDRILTSDGIEYVVTGIVPAYVANGILDHWEAKLELPV